MWLEGGGWRVEVAGGGGSVEGYLVGGGWRMEHLGSKVEYSKYRWKIVHFLVSHKKEAFIFLFKEIQKMIWDRFTKRSLAIPKRRL